MSAARVTATVHEGPGSDVGQGHRIAFALRLLSARQPRNSPPGGIHSLPNETTADNINPFDPPTRLRIYVYTVHRSNTHTQHHFINVIVVLWLAHVHLFIPFPSILFMGT